MHRIIRIIRDDAGNGGGALVGQRPLFFGLSGMSASEADCGVCGCSGCVLVAVLFFVWGLACMLVSEVRPQGLRMLRLPHILQRPGLCLEVFLFFFGGTSLLVCEVDSGSADAGAAFGTAIFSLGGDFPVCWSAGSADTRAAFNSTR